MESVLNKINNYKDIANLSILELNKLSKEIIQYIIQVVKTNGGHLGSPLATVDLTIALLKVFNLDNNKIVWDIGHQAYAYKILTDRKNSFTTLRQFNGISGFSNPTESNYDLFIGGHCSTSISTAMGLNVGYKQQKIANNYVISVIGDASIAAGMAFEAVNHLGSTNYNNIVILNDNNMSISNSVGGMHNYFTKVRTLPMLHNAKKLAEKVGDKIKNLSSNNFAKSTIAKIEHTIDDLFNIANYNDIFTNLGFEYYGPIDGHNIELMIQILTNITKSNLNKPILLHVNTTKGYGLEDADKHNKHSYSVDNKTINEISNTSLFANILSNLATTDDKIVAITAGMPSGTGVQEFAKKHADKIFDVGIAEQHAVGFAAGLAKSGLKPFVCIYSTFLQRCYDQIIHDVSIEGLPVKFILDRAGFVGADGATHAGLFDYSMLGNLPNFVVMASVFKEDLEEMLPFMANYNKGPISLRFNKANAFSRHLYSHNTVALEYGKGNILHKSNNSKHNIAIIGLGEILLQAFKANTEILNTHNIDCTIANAVFLNPIDENLIIELVKNNNYLITIEEGIGNVFGAKVLEIIYKHKLQNNIIVKNLYSINKFIEHASIIEQLKISELDYYHIANTILKLINYPKN